MNFKQSRRQHLVGGLGGMAAAVASSALPGLATAQAGETITVVEWGDPYLSAMKSVAEGQDQADINWVLHAGGSAAILPKIRATWPEPQFDIVAGWNPVFQAMIREGWCEPFTAADVPNIDQIPHSLIYKDDQGRFLNIPRTLSAIHWWYREDTCPIEIKTMDDLLDPKLEGQILFPDPILNTNLQIIMMSLYHGGDERSMEPGWDFIKELAQSGNIGRVAHADIDVINSISSGETSVTISGAPSAIAVQENFPVKTLTKVGRDTGFVTALYQEGWVVLKGGNTRAAFDFANHTISAENNEQFNAEGGGIPANVNAKASENLQHLAFTDDELNRYAYLPDWEFISEQVDGWMKRWEQEIVPLL